MYFNYIDVVGKPFKRLSIKDIIHMHHNHDLINIKYLMYKNARIGIIPPPEKYSHSKITKKKKK